MTERGNVFQNGFGPRSQAYVALNCLLSEGHHPEVAVNRFQREIGRLASFLGVRFHSLILRHECNLNVWLGRALSCLQVQGCHGK